MSVFLLYLLKNGNNPFRRIREEDVEVDPRLADNSFTAKVGHSDTFLTLFFLLFKFFFYY